MKLEVEESKSIEDGKHTGVITAVEYREKPYKYTDVVISFEESKTIKAGYPTCVTKESKLGKLLQEFGAEMEVGSVIDPELFLKDKEVQFLTMTNENGFANVVPNSLKRK